MDWIKPEFSKGAVNRAGRLLATPSNEILEWDTYSTALEIVNNWRASHNYPLNTFKVTLRQKAFAVDSHAIVAQRIKRMSSITLKLTRFPTMQLAQMQDLGGCRAILGSLSQVRMLQKRYKESDLKHGLDDVDDYISSPKDSGYRGIHLIWKYYSDSNSGARFYNGLFLEMQLRSGLQHAWATAVETVGTLLRQSLKSSQGEEKWLRFFALMGSAIARREKQDALVPNTPKTKTALVAELKKLIKDLSVFQTLSAYANAVNYAVQRAHKSDHYFLLNLEPSEGRMSVTAYKRNELERATSEYLEVEKKISKEAGAEAVLVSVDSLAVLRRAYPNYFLDTALFLEEVKEAIKR